MQRSRLRSEEFGTPLFVYDEPRLRERRRRAMAAFDGRVGGASKAAFRVG
ncbi:MAG: hypothetical protein IPF42_08805 [Candidatus Microthrix sp.]|nr:hypothetical protein [Candidatus Microthrix sp.]